MYWRERSRKVGGGWWPGEMIGLGEEEAEGGGMFVMMSRMAGSTCENWGEGGMEEERSCTD